MKMYTTQSYKSTISEIDIEYKDSNYIYSMFNGQLMRFDIHCKHEDIWETFEEAKEFLIDRQTDKIKKYTTLLEEAKFQLNKIMNTTETIKINNH